MSVARPRRVTYNMSTGPPCLWYGVSAYGFGFFALSPPVALGRELRTAFHAVSRDGRRQLRSHRAHLHFFVPADERGKGRSHSLTQQTKLTLTSSSNILTPIVAAHSPPTTYDLVVVLFRVWVLCGEGAALPALASPPPHCQRRELPRPVYCVLTYALALLLCCMCVSK